MPNSDESERVRRIEARLGADSGDARIGEVSRSSGEQTLYLFSVGRMLLELPDPQ